MKNLLMIVAALNASLVLAQGRAQARTVRDPPLATKQSLSPDPQLAGDVSRRLVAGEPTPGMTFSDYSTEQELRAYEEFRLQFEIRMFLYRKDGAARPLVI